jgi:hypothetical protein
MILYHSRPAEAVLVAFAQMMLVTNFEEMEAAGVTTTQLGGLVVYMALLKKAEAVVEAIVRIVVVEAVEWVLHLN